MEFFVLRSTPIVSCLIRHRSRSIVDNSVNRGNVSDLSSFFFFFLAGCEYVKRTPIISRSERSPFSGFFRGEGFVNRSLFFTSTMPEFFFPAETLEFLRTCAAERFNADLKSVKESAILAAEYYVPDRFNRYMMFVNHLV